MESNNEYLISEEEFKTLDIDNISEILLKDGTTLKFNQNTNKNFDICTCNKTNYTSRNSNSLIKEKNKFNTFSNKREFYVAPVPNALPKLIAIKLPEYQEQKEIKYNIKTFTFESEPKKYKYKPYKPPRRKHSSRIKYSGYKYLNQNMCACTCTCASLNKNKKCVCGQYCICGKIRKGY